jgi:hypothetical protein
MSNGQRCAPLSYRGHVYVRVCVGWVVMRWSLRFPQRKSQYTNTEAKKPFESSVCHSSGHGRWGVTAVPFSDPVALRGTGRRMALSLYTAGR